MEVKPINQVTFPEAAEAIETEAEVGNIKKGHSSKDRRKRN